MLDNFSPYLQAQYRRHWQEVFPRVKLITTNASVVLPSAAITPHIQNWMRLTNKDIKIIHYSTVKDLLGCLIPVSCELVRYTKVCQLVCLDFYLCLKFPFVKFAKGFLKSHRPDIMMHKVCIPRYETWIEYKTGEIRTHRCESYNT